MPTVSAVSPAPSVARRFGAVLAGLLAIFAASTAIDVALHLAGVFPPLDGPPLTDGLSALALSYRLVIDVAGCALTARLAPDRPMAHALALGGVGMVLGIAGGLAMRGHGPDWYPAVLAASSLPSAWLGGRLAGRRG